MPVEGIFHFYISSIPPVRVILDVYILPTIRYGTTADYFFLQLDYQNHLVNLPAACAPSPRTIARAECNRSTHPSIPQTAQYYRPSAIYPQVDSPLNGAESPDAVNQNSPCYLFQPRRSYPVVHPPHEVPLCEVSKFAKWDVKMIQDMKNFFVVLKF